MSGRAPSRNRRVNTPEPTRLRQRLHPRRTLQRMLLARPWTFGEIVCAVLAFVMLGFWGAFAVSYHVKDVVNTWIDLLIIAIVFSLAAIGQGVFVLWTARERRLQRRREEELELARQRGQEEGRRERAEE